MANWLHSQPTPTMLAQKMKSCCLTKARETNCRASGYWVHKIILRRPKAQREVEKRQTSSILGIWSSFATEPTATHTWDHDGSIVMPTASSYSPARFCTEPAKPSERVEENTVGSLRLSHENVPCEVCRIRQGHGDGSLQQAECTKIH